MGLHRFGGLVLVSYVLRVRASATIYSMTMDRSKRGVFIGRSLGKPSRTISLKMFISRTLSFVSDRTVPLSTMTIDYNPKSCAKLHVNISVTGNVYCKHGIPLVNVPALRILDMPILLCRRLPRSTLLYPVVSTQQVRMCTTVCSHTLGIGHRVSTSVISRGSCLRCLRRRPICFFKGKTTGYHRGVARPGTRFVSSLRPLTGVVFPLTRGTITVGSCGSITCFRPFCLGRFITSRPGGLLWYFSLLV